MGFFRKLFASEPEPVIIIEPPKPKPVPPKPPVDNRTPEEKLLQEEGDNIKKANTAIDKAQEEIYQRRGQLNVREASLKQLGIEIEGHEKHWADLQSRAKVCATEDRRDITNEGQKVQRLLTKKRAMFASQQQSMVTFEHVIDGLEVQLGRMEIESNERQSNLTNVETLYVAHQLSESMTRNLAQVSFNAEDNKLAILGETIKLKVEDKTVELSATIRPQTECLTFREQALEGELVDDKD